MIEKTLAILAGGKSSRMNYNNKAFLDYNGKAFIEHIIEAGKNFKEIIIVANNKEIYRKFNLKVVEDVYKDKGPLGGIYSALVNATYDKVLCVACDMPLIRKNTLSKLGEIGLEYDVLIPKIEDRLQPLCSVYSKSIIDKVEYNLINNENKLQNLIMELDYKVIEDELECIDFININTPKDYEQL